MELGGKIALVTGAASGIGLACAKLLMERGASVILSDVEASKVAQATASLGDGSRAHGCVLDVTKEADWAAAMTLAGTLGGLDILINNAGFGRYDSVETETLEGWRSVTACILDGPFLGMRAAIPLMKERGEGAIVTVASAASHSGIPHSVAYCAGKAGVVGLTRSAAVHCAKAGYNIRVNAVHPGNTATLQVMALDTEESGHLLKSMIKMTPLGRLAGPEEIAAAVVYLAGPGASFITGASLMVDGGFLAQ